MKDQKRREKVKKLLALLEKAAKENSLPIQGEKEADVLAFTLAFGKALEHLRSAVKDVPTRYTAS